MHVFIKSLAFALLVLLAFAPCCCTHAADERPTYTAMSKVTTAYFSTASRLLLYDDFTDPERRHAFGETWEAVKDLLEEIDQALSPSRETSDVSRYNRLRCGESIAISPHTANVLSVARQVYALSGGAYDPTVSALVDLWGFSPRFTSAYSTTTMPYDRPRLGAGFALPEDEYVEGLQELVCFPAIQMEGLTLTKTAAPVEIQGTLYEQTLDLGGIGKGYAVDQVTALLRERGYVYGHFSCGGSSLAVLQRAIASKGAPEPAQWGVAIEKPRFRTREAPAFMRVFARDMALSTSGDYEHTYMMEGVRYTHLIDPVTGYPINRPVNGIQKGLCSATVFGPNAAFDDALSTALCVMGLKDALALMNTEPLAGYGFVLTLYDGSQNYCEYVTNLPPAQCAFLDEAHYRRACVQIGGKVIYTGTFIDNQ
jgi:thiamine biosynthesis lipoprotein